MLIGRDMPVTSKRAMMERCPSCARALSIKRRVRLPAVCTCGWIQAQFDLVLWCRGYQRASDAVLRQRIQELNTFLSTSAKGGDEIG